MASLEECRELLQREYNRVWADWYAGRANLRPAALDVRFGDGSAGYSRTSNELLICVSDENIPDFDRHLRGERHWSGKLKWFVHQAELIHEMLHEYQFKILTEPSQEGLALSAKYRGKFFGPDHDELFFSAIAEKAEYFGVSADQFVNEL
jgi:hypothetical protein